MNQTRRGVRQTETRTARPLARPARSHAYSVIKNSDGELVAQAPSRHLNITGAGAGADAMTYRVLHQRLEQQARNQRASNAVLDIAVDRESIPEPHALDGDVPIE